MLATGLGTPQSSLVKAYKSFVAHSACLPRSARQRRIAMASNAQGLVVISAEDAPEIEMLKALPKELPICGIGRTLEELKGVQDWTQVTALLNCGIGPKAGKKQTIQDLWPKMKNLKWVHSASAGIENVVFPELVDSSVVLTNAKGTFSHALAEFAIFGCSYFAKAIPRMLKQKQAHNWEKFNVQELRGHTMGVVGYGDIGQACARLGKAHGMNIIAMRRRTELSQQEQQQGLEVYTPDRLHQLMADADYVVAALPSTPATQKLISAEAIAAMKPGGVFVNVGRGVTVDEDALISALRDGRIKGAAMDVFASEPLPESSPLWDLENVLITPHCADQTDTFQHEAIEQFVDNAKRFVKGEALLNTTDKKSGY